MRVVLSTQQATQVRPGAVIPRGSPLDYRATQPAGMPIAVTPFVLLRTIDVCTRLPRRISRRYGSGGLGTDWPCWVSRCALREARGFCQNFPSRAGWARANACCMSLPPHRCTACPFAAPPPGYPGYPPSAPPMGYPPGTQRTAPRLPIVIDGHCCLKEAPHPRVLVVACMGCVLPAPPRPRVLACADCRRCRALACGSAVSQTYHGVGFGYPPAPGYGAPAPGHPPAGYDHHHHQHHRCTSHRPTRL